jgi:hypothetical protein
MSWMPSFDPVEDQCHKEKKIYSTNITEPGPVPDTVGLGRPFSIVETSASNDIRVQ